jgi:DnaK suppressor protein
MTTNRALSSSQLRELRSELEQELAWLLRSLTNKRSTSADSSSDPSAAASERDEMEQMLRDRAQSRLAGILAALRRLETGAYGECVRCRQPIPLGRLVVMPDATHCIACGGHGAPLQAHGTPLNTR